MLIVLLLIFHHSGNPPYSKVSAQWTFRVSFAIMAVMTLWLAYFRYYKKVYSSTALQRSKKNARVNQSGYDVKSLKLVMTHFGGRLIGTTSGWFFNDFLFYGNKLFASTFIRIISPGATNNVMTTWLWNLVNIGVSLCGYYLAAFLIDHKFYGRRRMQVVGFLADAVLFLICASEWKSSRWRRSELTPYSLVQPIVQPSTHPRFPDHLLLVFLLPAIRSQVSRAMVSRKTAADTCSCTTFLLAAEVFPISVRATAHGLSAAAGKLGALLPAIVYNYVDNHTKFWIVCWFGFAGWIATLIFIPDTTGLDLKEQDRYWRYVREGRPEEYHGIAVHPRHLSWYEKVVLKRHLAYNPELDRADKAEELRRVYEQRMQSKTNEGEKVEQDAEDEEEISSEATSFFEKTPRLLAQNPPVPKDRL
jgi:hypothetical protein